jgi:hypothetical protein
MSRCKVIGDLFEEEPERYGLRGDMYLWIEMRAHFSEAPLPATPSELEDQLAHAFLLLSGHPLSSPESFRVERFAHGGISSGLVSPGFWRKRATAIIKERYAATKLLA